MEETSVHARLHRVQRLSRLLDDWLRIPGTRYRIGLDGLIGLVPGLGDVIGTLLSAYILFEAIQLILQRDLSGLRLPSTLTIELKRMLSMGAIGRIVAHLMIPNDFNRSLEIEDLLPQCNGQQRPRLW
jgi:Domain of unknown function (DUF4112)